MQAFTFGHSCTGSCICTMRETRGGRKELVVNPGCLTRGHSKCVKFVSFSPDGSRIASGSEDRLVKIWDVENGAEVSNLERVW